MTVRRFKPNDFTEICDIYLDAKRDELRFEQHSFEITPLEQDATILAAFNESDVYVFDDGKLLGFAAVFQGQLRALFVHGNARGKGVGQALLATVLRNESGSVSLNVAKSNVDALRFYERSGFAAAGEISRDYAGHAVHYVKMCIPGRAGA